MKRTLIFLLCFAAYGIASGQQILTEEIAEAQTPVNIGLEEVNNVFTPPAVFSKNLKSGGTETGKISVTYLNFPEEAKIAFEYAVSIWEKSVYSPVQINIHANWESLSGNVLANGKPSLFYRNFKGAPQPNVYFPVALVEKVTGKEYNSSTEADVTCYFNKSKPWYFGTNGKTPDNQYDFVTAVLHEIGHGLGISGFFTFENGVGKYSNSSNTPSIYDYFVFNSNQQQIADQSIFPSPSAELTVQLTSNSLVFNCTAQTNETSDVSIYAPNAWENGLSIYHLQKTDFSQGAPNELMSAHSYKGEAIHNPGENTLYILSEMGWTVNASGKEAIAANNNGKEKSAIENVNVYPNPFSGNLTFDCEKINTQSSVDINITNLMGETVFRQTMNDIKYKPKLQIDLSMIKPGIYMAILTDTNQKSISKRIIKN